MIDKKVGIIGYGNMGSILVNGFADSGIIKKSNIIISTRTKVKLSNLKDSGYEICSSNIDLAKKSNLIFLCVKPFEIKDVLIEIKNALIPDKHIISIAVFVTIDNIESVFNGKISRVLPTVISKIKEGITLICHNSKVSNEEKNILETLLSTISEIKNVKENEFEILSDLTSCAPGLIAAIFREYVESVLPYTDFPEKEINDLVIKTLFGTAKLFYEKNFNFDSTIKQVATRGGITEAGVRVLKNKLPEIFNDMLNKTLKIQKIGKQKIDEQFNN